MNGYIDVLKVEAKALLKKFQQKDNEAKTRCAKYFGTRDDLSLMNVQHVIAKEYGFHDWDEVANAEGWELAAALIATKNKTLTSPLSVWYGENDTYAAPERYKLARLPEADALDWEGFKKRFDIIDIADGFHFANLDVARFDLSEVDMAKSTFDKYTDWPEDSAKLPQGFAPDKYLEERKSFGLGIRALHKKGVTGKGRAVAIINNYSLRNHLEYRDNLLDYVDLSGDKRNACYGGKSVSVLVGKHCGLAPDAKVYFYSVGHVGTNITWVKEALKMVYEKHVSLKENGTSGIDVVCLMRGLWSHELEACKDELEKLNAEGVFVIDYTNWYDLPHKELYCKFGKDIDDFNSYEEPKKSLFRASKPEKEVLCFPSFGHTIAHQYRLDAYRYEACSCALEFKAGLYLSAKSVKESLSFKEFWRIALKTGDYRKGIGTIVNPQRLIEALK